MKYENVEHLVNQKPFVPFRVVMADGETWEVRGREHVLLTPSTLHIGVGHAEGSLIHDRLIPCPLTQIDRIELLDQPAPAVS